VRVLKGVSVKGIGNSGIGEGKPRNFYDHGRQKDYTTFSWTRFTVCGHGKRIS